jgi:hypothetical protein
MSSFRRVLAVVLRDLVAPRGLLTTIYKLLRKCVLGFVVGLATLFVLEGATNIAIVSEAPAVLAPYVADLESIAATVLFGWLAIAVFVTLAYFISMLVRRAAEILGGFGENLLEPLLTYVKSVRRRAREGTRRSRT